MRRGRYETRDMQFMISMICSMHGRLIITSVIAGSMACRKLHAVELAKAKSLLL